jgi:hypothetical protein
MCDFFFFVVNANNDSIYDRMSFEFMRIDASVFITLERYVCVSFFCSKGLKKRKE